MNNCEMVGCCCCCCFCCYNDANGNVPIYTIISILIIAMKMCMENLYLFSLRLSRSFFFFLILPLLSIAISWCSTSFWLVCATNQYIWFFFVKYRTETAIKEETRFHTQHRFFITFRHVSLNIFHQVLVYSSLWNIKTINKLKIHFNFWMEYFDSTRIYRVVK